MARGSGLTGVAALALAALVAGCAVGPDFVPPAAPDVHGYTPDPLGAHTASAGTVQGGQAQRFVRNLDLPGQWWTLFHSKPLNALVERALANNADVQVAQAALRVARENVRAQRGTLFPQVDANFNAIRLLPQPTAPEIDNTVVAPTYNLFTTQLNVAYTPDVFGGLGRAIENLEALEDAQRFQLEATYLTLTSNLAGAAVQEASLRGQIAATERIIKIERDFLGLLREQRRAGQIAELDVASQEAALAQVELTLPPLQKALALQRDLMAALAGGYPSEKLAETFELAAMRLPRDLPVSLPSRLIEQRPDIKAAEANLHAAGALVGVAIANRLPNIVITGVAGSTAPQIGQLFASGTEWWEITGAVTQPLFHGGTLFHRELAAKAAWDQAKAQYRSTVIVAFQNVGDVLQAIRSDAIALEKAVAAERAANKSLEIVRGQLRLGQIAYLGLLTAQQTYQQALLSLAQAKAQRYADTVALFAALGGGWWNRQDVAPEKPLTIGDFFQ